LLRFAVQALASLLDVLPKVQHLKTIIYIDTDGSDKPTEGQLQAAKAAGANRRSSSISGGHLPSLFVPVTRRDRNSPSVGS
jgi:hypothetical protein